MHPALSIILFSTLSGAGFGLGAVIGIFALPDGSTVLSFFPLFAPTFVAGVLASVGLVCSVFHLRRPDRAWRAFSQWRSSWLSREGVLAVAALVLLASMAFVTRTDSTFSIAIGLSAAALCALTVFATSMIYAQIRAVPAWHTFLTPMLFLAHAAGSGILSAAVLTAGFSSVAVFRGTYISDAHLASFGGFATAASAAIVVAWIIQEVWWWRLRRTGLGKSTPETATRLEDWGKVRLLEPPHTGPNYLTDEMVFKLGRRHAPKLRILATMFGGLAPIIILVPTQTTNLSVEVEFILAFMALITHLFGVGLSRWLFFAESRHTVSLYYQG